MNLKWAYYNEFDPDAAEWLRQLIKLGAIPDGEVDERSIREVSPEDLKGFLQCHFFAGIGGWSEVLRGAGIPSNRSVWTGSCPCQAFSCAGKQKGFSDDRDLWPVFFNLIRECRPEQVFGEQVANAVRFGWLDRLYADLEGAGYACGSAVLGAHSAGADHIRQRIYWMADACGIDRQRGGAQLVIDGLLPQGGSRDGSSGDCERKETRDGLADAESCGREQQPVCQSTGVQRQKIGETERVLAVGGHGAGACGVADAEIKQRDGIGHREISEQPESANFCGVGGVADAIGERGCCGESRREDASDAWQSGQTSNFWSDARPHLCKDGKLRRFEPGVQPLVAKLRRNLGRGGDIGVPVPDDEVTIEKVDATGEARVLRLKGYGNALCVETGVMFVRATTDVLESSL